MWELFACLSGRSVVMADHASCSSTNSAVNHLGSINRTSNALFVSPVFTGARQFGPPWGGLKKPIKPAWISKGRHRRRALKVTVSGVMPRDTAYQCI